MSLAAVGFDSLHIAPEVIREILIALHREGRAPHHWLLDVEGRVVEAAVQAVKRCWIDTAPRRGAGRHPVETYPLMCDVPLYLNVHSASRLADEGTSGYAVAHLALLFEPPAHQGVVPEKFAHSVRFDFTSTVASDIELPAPLANDLAIKEGIVGLVHSTFSGTYPLPPGELRDLSAQHPIEIVPVLTPTPQLVARPLSQLRDAAGRRLATPPAKGVPFPTIHEARWQLVVGHQRVLPLAKRTFSRLVHRKFQREAQGSEPMLVKGDLRDGALGLHIELTSAPLKVEVRAAGHNRNGLRWMAAFEGGMSDEDLLLTMDDLDLSEPMASKAAVTAREAGVGIAVLHEKHQLRRTGLHLSGLIGQVAEGVPQPEFQWYRQLESDRRVTFDACRSWCPGASIQRLVWDFGDGTVRASQAPDISIVVAHTFGDNGPYNVTLTVIDDSERQASFRSIVELDKLSVIASIPAPSPDGRLVSRLRVLRGNAPVPGVDLALSTSGESASARTDEDGYAEFRAGFAPFFGVVRKARERRARVGRSAELVVSSGERILRFPASVMDRETFDAIVETTHVSRLYARLGDEAADGSAAKHLRRRALALASCLWRGEVPSWAAPHEAAAGTGRLGRAHVLALRERVIQMARRVERSG